tara:strand:+ start:25 stop:234 length:210 start_codon:yes stop_codon:yes gene_type:complete
MLPRLERMHPTARLGHLRFTPIPLILTPTRKPHPPQVDAQRRAELEVVTQLRAAKRALETLTAAAPGLD